MCYAIPGRVTSIDGRMITVDYFGEKRKALNEFDDIKIGDYIYAQGGYAVKKIEPDEAHSILSTWKETFFELQEKDLQLSRMDLEKKGLSRKTAEILDSVNEGRRLEREPLAHLFSLEDEDEVAFILKDANFLRQKYHKNSCCVHGIIEISNNCRRACSYCGISAVSGNVSRYTMTPGQIFDAAREAAEVYGFQALVLQSGEDCGIDPESLGNVIKKIRYELGVLAFISFGEITDEEMDLYYEAGARGMLLRFETSNPELYAKLHPGKTLKTRLKAIESAYGKGYLIITGALVGLPGQTDQDIVNDVLTARRLNTEMYSFGPFIPAPGTPLEKEKPPSAEKMLKVLALCRFADPENGKVLVTTAFETLTPSARKEGLLAGASSVMLNVTPPEYRRRYSIYPGRAYEDTAISQQIEQTLGLLKSLGRAPTDLGAVVRKTRD